MKFCNLVDQNVEIAAVFFNVYIFFIKFGFQETTVLV